MSERPYQPFYKPYGMTDEEYEYEKRIAAEKLAEWEQEQNESNLLDTQVKPACETLQIIDEMLREADILKEHKNYVYNLDNAERLRGYKLALQRLKQKIVSKSV